MSINKNSILSAIALVSHLDTYPIAPAVENRPISGGYNKPCKHSMRGYQGKCKHKKLSFHSSTNFSWAWFKCKTCKALITQPYHIQNPTPKFPWEKYGK